MEKTLHSSNLYSHPDRLLEDHLIGAAQLSEIFIMEKPVPIKDKLINLSRIIALSHDIGKATNYFQEYLNADEKEKEKLKNQKETKHGLFSAVCAYYLAKELNYSDVIYPVFAFLAVKRHHGNLRDIFDDIAVDDKNIGNLLKQLESINDENFAVLCNKLLHAGLPLQLNKDLLSQWINNLIKESMHIRRNLRKINSSVSNYVILNLLYSILLDADKSDVVIKDTGVFARKEFKSDDWVDNYKSKTIFIESPINTIREKAYREVIGNDINLNSKIYSLNLPTGLGKTLTSLSFALKLRENIKSQSGVIPRIIYSLPFLSIIDQNYDVFESVIKANSTEPDTSILLKHHHLSDIFYEKEDDEFETDEAKILIEGWNAEIIVTTFVQLFHTLISNSNKNIRKFHRLANAIIILDEVQSIPVKYWLLLRNVLTEISEMLNVYILFVTATEPLIFDKEEIKALINKDYYFNILNRVSLIPRLESATTINDLPGYFDLSNEKSYLFIFNTITAARDFHNLIRSKNISLTYLSTHVMPKERLKRIKDIKEGRYKVVVSTQLVEAGIDIDFDIVVRDIAPLDSINQASGRCNRNGNNRGNVYIVILKDDRGRSYASYVYDSILIDITQKILSEKGEIKEGEFLKLIETYYLQTRNAKTQDISRRLLEAIIKLRYDREDQNDKSRASIAEFRLMDEDYQKKDIFIELDEDAANIWREYIKLKDIDNLFMRKKAFDSIKAKFYQYVISIPANTKNMPTMIGEIGYVKQAVLMDYYDSETGFITKETKSVVIW